MRPTLTARETEVLRALCESADPVKYIAVPLKIRPHTLKKYVHQICEKVGAESRLQLMMWGWANGIGACPCGKHEADPGGYRRAEVAKEALRRARAEITDCLKALNATGEKQ